MSASIDQAVKIVRKALDTAPDDLNTFLTDECEGDTELRQLVETMLRQASGIVDNEQQTGDALDPLLGQRLGAFRVVERVGRGGMGVVYRGEREDAGFAQVVALKLIRKGLDFDEVQARFLRERRILSRLSHPNLARFIDGGVAPDGRPWFALEFVQGQPLLAWCDDHRLDVRARVKLFLDVCAAVQYAHTQLVVHRDLKPGNVLVDADGAPRLLDFGISRLLEGHEGEATLTVEGKRFAFTPEYAAPEQFGGEAGIAADVYSLGAILYRLIAGVLPYPIDRRDLAEAERIVRTTPPQPLVQAIARVDASSGADTSQARLAARDTSLRVYRATVRGDLSRILDKALAKEPERRYASVQSFAEDLQHWLDGVPVRASGNAFGYRLRKFVGRNRAAVGVAAVLLLAVIAAAGWALHNAARADRERDAALVEARRADAVRQYMLLMFRESADRGNADTTTTHDLLAHGAERLFDEYKNDPGTAFDVVIGLGEFYRLLGDNESAASLYERALASPQAARFPEALAVIRRDMGEVEVARGNTAHARELLDAAQVFWDRDPEHYRAPLLESRTVQSRIERSEGKTDAAIATLQQAMREADRNANGKPTIQRMQFEGALALAFVDAVRYDEAKAAAEAALRDCEALNMADSSNCQAALNNLAVATARKGDMAGAEKTLRRLLAIREQIAPDSEGTALVRMNIALILQSRKNYKEAIPLLQKALPVLVEKGGGEGARGAMVARSVLEEILTYDGRYDEAAPLVETQLRLAHGKQGPDRVPEGTAYRARARIRLARGDIAGARADAAEAERIFMAAGPTGKEQLAILKKLQDQLPKP